MAMAMITILQSSPVLLALVLFCCWERQFSFCETTSFALVAVDESQQAASCLRFRAAAATSKPKGRQLTERTDNFSSALATSMQIGRNLTRSRESQLLGANHGRHELTGTQKGSGESARPTPKLDTFCNQKILFLLLRDSQAMIENSKRPHRLH